MANDSECLEHCSRGLFSGWCYRNPRRVAACPWLFPGGRHTVLPEKRRENNDKYQCERSATMPYRGTSYRDVSPKTYGRLPILPAFSPNRIFELRPSRRPVEDCAHAVRFDVIVICFPVAFGRERAEDKSRLADTRRRSTSSPSGSRQPGVFHRSQAI
ncbi:hypothetical protein ZHAS_00008368 [Anopheles sinensis]|uniref:Uncharacterized protein n=1 Tax=Anopheles sinensis TaxID=74873 RepID=A0A084VSA2_ANOSI|nr:hypothetical protein ZHAS_00008368 [Anopheles sinensis]